MFGAGEVRATAVLTGPLECLGHIGIYKAVTKLSAVR
jgi:hypothetical protein